MSEFSKESGLLSTTGQNIKQPASSKHDPCRNLYRLNLSAQLSFHESPTFCGA